MIVSCSSCFSLQLWKYWSKDERTMMQQWRKANSVLLQAVSALAPDSCQVRAWGYVLIQLSCLATDKKIHWLHSEIYNRTSLLKVKCPCCLTALVAHICVSFQVVIKKKASAFQPLGLWHSAARLRRRKEAIGLQMLSGPQVKWFCSVSFIRVVINKYAALPQQICEMCGWSIKMYIFLQNVCIYL